MGMQVQSSLLKLFYGRPISPVLIQLKIWKFKKLLYGLNDAARQFYKSLASELIEIGCVQNSLDPALFSLFVDNQLVGALVTHVDDILHTGTDSFDNLVMDRLYARFSAGSRQNVNFVYTGYNISQNTDFSILLDQDSYVDSIDVF